MRLSDVKDFQSYPKVFEFIRDDVSMQMEDIRVILGHTMGCNYAIANVICDVVSGISVSIYMPPSPYGNNDNGGKSLIGSGKAFERVIDSRYPFQKGSDRGSLTNALYKWCRNPLTHSLGVDDKSGQSVLISRRSQGILKEVQLAEMVESEERPTWLQPGLFKDGKNWHVHTEVDFPTNGGHPVKGVNSPREVRLGQVTTHLHW